MEQNSGSEKMIRRGTFRVAYRNEDKLIIGCIIGAVLCVEVVQCLTD